MKRLKPSTGGFILLRICTLYFTGIMKVTKVISVNTWEFDPTYSCEFLTLVGFVWMLVPLCSLGSQL